MQRRGELADLFDEPQKGRRRPPRPIRFLIAGGDVTLEVVERDRYAATRSGAFLSLEIAPLLAPRLDNAILDGIDIVHARYHPSRRTA